MEERLTEERVMEERVMEAQSSVEQSSEALIRVLGVTKRYGELVAVHDVSLSVGAGEAYGLVGANGAGKSTLIRMLTGLSVPDAGDIRICGHEVRRQSLAAKRQLGYLPEELYLYALLTVVEYLALFAGLKDTVAASVQDESEFLARIEV